MDVEAEHRRAGASRNAQDLPIRVLANEAMPLYLQIVHQFKQLIMTGELSDGAKLPTVRVLADQLDINPGTVMQAYRQLANDGLTASVRGRGTVVRTSSEQSDDDLLREQLLEVAIGKLVSRSRALKFDRAQTQHRVTTALLGRSNPVVVLFMGATLAQSERYSELLNSRIDNPGVIFEASMVQEALERTDELAARLEVAYTILAFAPNVPEISRSLREWGVSAEVVGVRAELSEASQLAVSAMQPQARYTLITENRAVTTVLGLLGIADRAKAIDVISTDLGQSIDSNVLAEVANSDSTIIYTFGVQEIILNLGIAADRLIPLEFGFTESTWRALERRWRTCDE